MCGRGGRREERKRGGEALSLCSPTGVSVTFTMMNEGGGRVKKMKGNEKQQASTRVWARTRATGVDVGSHTTKTKKEILIKKKHANKKQATAATAAATHKYSERGRNHQ